MTNKKKNKNSSTKKKEAPRVNDLEAGVFGGNPFATGTQISQTDTIEQEIRGNLITNQRHLLSQVYVEIGLVKTMVDVPVEDALRGHITINTSELDSDDIKKLHTKMRREKDIHVLGQAIKWMRLYGGGGIIIINEDKPEDELDIKKIKIDEKITFKSVDLWELYGNTENYTDITEKLEHLSDIKEVNYRYYQNEVHPTRVMKLRGIQPPAHLKGRVHGFGLSILESVIRSVNQYLKATNVAFEVLDEFKIDVFKIAGLTETLMTSGGDAKIHKRISLANREKSYLNAITMDGDDDYIQKQLQFTGLAEAMEGIRMQVASDLRMPLTKLFGVSSAGFNSGEDDIENYNAMIESSIRSKIEFELLKMVEIRCQQLFGIVPEDLEVEFEPLRVMSSEQEENVKTQKFNRALQARTVGEISATDFKEAMNIDNLIGVQLDVTDELFETSEDAITGDEVAPIGSSENAPEAKESK